MPALAEQDERQRRLPLRVVGRRGPGQIEMPAPRPPRRTGRLVVPRERDRRAPRGRRPARWPTRSARRRSGRGAGRRWLRPREPCGPYPSRRCVATSSPRASACLPAGPPSAGRTHRLPPVGTARTSQSTIRTTLVPTPGPSAKALRRPSHPRPPVASRTDLGAAVSHAWPRGALYLLTGCDLSSVAGPWRKEAAHRAAASPVLSAVLAVMPGTRNDPALTGRVVALQLLIASWRAGSGLRVDCPRSPGQPAFRFSVLS